MVLRGVWGNVDTMGRLKKDKGEEKVATQVVETLFHYYPELADEPLDVDDEESLTGRTIQGRFEVRELIGHGGFGSVYLARQTSVDRLVVLKVLRGDLVQKKSMERRFLLEAKATSRLNNPHTVTIFDYGKTDDGLLYIAMEYLRGRTLLAKIEEEGKLSVDESIRIACEMAESLAEAHSHQIVHRDLKPENVLLVETPTAQDFVKVLDFGIAHARPISGDMTLTRTGQLSGTPPYMSPEIIRGKKIDARADVYSMAIMIYQMLSGKCPFRGDTPFDIFMKHVQEKPPTLKEMGVQVSPPLQKFLDRCLAKDAKKRPIDAGAFLRELRKLVGKESQPHVHARMASEHTSHDLQSLNGVKMPLGKNEPTDVYPETSAGFPGLRGKYGPKTEMFVISRIRRAPRIWATIVGLCIAGVLAAIVTGETEIERKVPAATRSQDAGSRVKAAPSKTELPIEKTMRTRSSLPEGNFSRERFEAARSRESISPENPTNTGDLDMDGSSPLPAPVESERKPAERVSSDRRRAPMVKAVTPVTSPVTGRANPVSVPVWEKAESASRSVKPVSKIDVLLD
jgi:serine/threonine protein kinase